MSGKSDNVFDGATFQKLFQTPEQTGEAAAERKLHLEKLAAQAEAERLLAEMHCPADIKDFAARHGLGTFIDVTWQNGFMAGFRLGLSRRAPETTDQNT